MPTSLPSRVLALLLAGCAFLPAARAQPDTGSVEGRVFNAATGSALVNARVALEGSGREAITDEAGGFRFTGVPAGGAQLSVSYVGLTAQIATVNVAAGGTAQRDFARASA